VSENGKNIFVRPYSGRFQTIIVVGRSPGS